MLQLTKTPEEFLQAFYFSSAWQNHVLVKKESLTNPELFAWKGVYDGSAWKYEYIQSMGKLYPGQSYKVILLCLYFP